MPVQRQAIPPAAAPVALLLLADPSEAKLAAYLPPYPVFPPSPAPLRLSTEILDKSVDKSPQPPFLLGYDRAPVF